MVISKMSSQKRIITEKRSAFLFKMEIKIKDLQ